MTDQADFLRVQKLVSKSFIPNRLEYLYSPPTYPVWQCVAEFIKDQNSRKILDLGSSYGGPQMLDMFLEGYDYEYLGVDVSKSLIDYANQLYAGRPNIKFCQASWDDIDPQEEYDCMLLLGVLPYGMPILGYGDYSSPWDLYMHLKNKFNTRQIIIKETDGDEWKGIKLMDLTPFENIATDIRRFDVSASYKDEDIALGKKVVYNVITS